MRDMNRLKKKVDRIRGATRGTFFNKARLPNTAQTTRNHTIGRMASVESMIRKPSLTPEHKGWCIEWSRKYMAGGHEGRRSSSLMRITYEDDHT